MDTKPRFGWSDAYLAGFARIDQDHKYLFDKLSEACDALSGGNRSEVSRDIVNGLMDFTQLHFPDEESIMQISDSDDYLQHKAFHLFLLLRTQDMQEKIRLGYPVALQDVIGLLEVWIESDVLEKDLKLSQSTINKSVQFSGKTVK